jgi:hypothetical protein
MIEDLITGLGLVLSFIAAVAILGAVVIEVFWRWVRRQRGSR